MEGQRFSSKFTGKEFFLADHVIHGQRVLPGVAHLEMARAAVQRSVHGGVAPGACVRLSGVVWARAVIAGSEPLEVHVEVYRAEGEELGYEIFSEPADGAEVVVHSQGNAVVSALPRPAIDLAGLRRRVHGSMPSAEQCYAAFSAVGIEYGATHRGLKHLEGGVDERGRRFVLADLSTPAAGAAPGEYVLHPAVMDSALHAAVALMFEEQQHGGVIKPLLPFALEEVQIFADCAQVAHAFVSRSTERDAPVQKFDIDVCDAHGLVCVRLKGLAWEDVASETESEAEPEAIDTVLLEPRWELQEPASAAMQETYAEHHVLLCGFPTESAEEDCRHAIEGRLPQAQVLSLRGSQHDVAQQFSGIAAQLLEVIQNIERKRSSRRVLLQAVVTPGDDSLLMGLAGLLRSAHLEQPHLVTQLIAVERHETGPGLTAKLLENLDAPEQREIRYRDERRYVAAFRQLSDADPEAPAPWKDGSVYLISGGVGGLGLIFAAQILERAKDARVILVGRSALDEDKAARLRELQGKGSRVEYEQLDVGDESAVLECVAGIVERHGRLDGVLHSAGVIKDSFLIKKTREEFAAVLRPKVAGTVNLDRATGQLPLDFFILFSSLAGSFGNVGQADYAAANAFMDQYAAHRDALVRAGRRYGRSLSINWPLWQAGGMRISDASIQQMAGATGLVPISTQRALRAFERVLARPDAQILVLEGRRTLLRGIAPMSEPARVASPVVPDSSHSGIKEQTLAGLKRVFAPVIGLSPEQMDAEEPFESYGLDSIMISQINGQLTELSSELSQTLIYEHQTLASIADYLVADHHAACVNWTAAAQATPAPFEVAITPSSEPALLDRAARLPSRRVRRYTSDAPRAGEPIAIIGMSGRYPRAANLEEFWENLKEGRDCIDEIPAERWPLEDFYVPELETAVVQGKSYSKWGGFVDGFADFDPLFFNISPREAADIDPQERLFLQACWQVARRRGLHARTVCAAGISKRVGVFAGITKTGFDLYGPALWRQGRNLFRTPRSARSPTACRIS